MNYVKLGSVGALVVLAILYALGGMTHVSPGEVGILIKNVGSETGMQKEVLDIGTHWVDPFTYDVVTYDTRCRQMQEKPEAQIAGTADGQPVEVDFTIQLCLAPKDVPQLHQNLGPQYYDNAIHPAVISVVKNMIPSKKSDEVYTAAGRLDIENSINGEIKRRYGAEGILVEINLRDIKFTNGEYVKILEAKARASQQVEVNTRNALAAVQEGIRVANVAEGLKQQTIREAEAQREKARLEGEGSRLQQEETAKGNLAVATAEAAGIRLRREALSGAGGSELVSIEWARNLGPNIKVYGFPTGSPGSTSIMDLNGIMQGALTGGKK